MPNRFWLFIWLGLGAASVLLLLTDNAVSDAENWRFWVAAVIAIISTLGLIPATQPWLRKPLQHLRGLPNVWWLLLIALACVGLGLWLVPYQPTYGRWLRAIEIGYMLALAWLLLGLLAFDLTQAQAGAVGAKLSQSRLTGLSILLTTCFVLFFGSEAYLRIFYITTDSYGFTAMNYHWYANFYWGRFNSLGFRDHEPKPDPENSLMRVAVVGDSFAVGHGMADIDQTFPQLIERGLGETHDVLLVAQSGWDSDVETFELDRFPLRPQTVILSYYLNDIDYLLQDAQASPDANFDFIEDANVQWFVLNFFVPNYLYYNIAQFSSQTRARNFVADLVDAHTDDAIWARHTPNLAAMVDWARTHDARLIVAVWPHLAAIDATQPATSRVSSFFRQAGAEVVDLSEVLRGESPASLIVNRFDAHPGPLAHRLAAEALLAQIAQGEGE